MDRKNDTGNRQPFARNPALVRGDQQEHRGGAPCEIRVRNHASRGKRNEATDKDLHARAQEESEPVHHEAAGHHRRQRAGRHQQVPASLLHAGVRQAVPRAHAARRHFEKSDLRRHACKNNIFF